MGGWVLAVSREALRRIRKHSNLAGFIRPLQQGRTASLESASWSRELCLGTSISSAPLLKVSSELSQAASQGMALLPQFSRRSAYLALGGGVPGEESLLIEHLLACQRLSYFCIHQLGSGSTASCAQDQGRFGELKVQPWLPFYAELVRAFSIIMTYRSLR